MTAAVSSTDNDNDNNMRGHSSTTSTNTSYHAQVVRTRGRSQTEADDDDDEVLLTVEELIEHCIKGNMVNRWLRELLFSSKDSDFDQKNI
jgi:hypothetical protein